MSLVVITISDDGDGSVDIKLVAEPPLAMRDESANTAAHIVAMNMLSAAASEADDVKVSR